MRAPGKRCQGRYCFSALRRLYDQDPETIVKSNRMMINPAEHCPPSEAKYAWKCPRCRGKCLCSICRKAAGLEPLGKPFGASKQTKTGPSDTSAADTSEIKPKKAKSKAEANGTGSGTAKATARGKSKDRNIAEAVAAAQKPNGKGKSKSSAATGEDVDDGNEDDGVHTPPPPSSKPAPKRTLASLLSNAAVRAPAFKPFEAPAEATPPVFEIIPTKLPEENMRVRMWIYESFVRFDKFGLNRGVLSQLDKLEHWTHAMAQDMLACLLKTVAGMTNIEKGQPTKPFVKAITAFRTHGKSLQRGEPWSAATELLSIFGLTRSPLAFVEHDVPVEVEAAAAQRSPSPPVTRVTRARRAKESNQYEIARQLSLLDRWEEDEFGDDDDKDAVPSKRRRASTKKKSIYVYDDPSDDDESMADPDDSARSRRSGRARKADEKEPAPEVRLTGRQQAIKLQQEQQKEEQAAAKKQRQEEEDEARQAQVSRKRRQSSNGTASGVSDDEGIQRNGLSHKKRRRLTAGSSDDEAGSDDDDDDDAIESRDKDHGDKKSNGATDDQGNEQAEQEVESPDLETKVSILSALIDAAVMADSVAEELKTATENMASMDRAHKAANVEMEREIVEELAELNKRAPSIVSPEYQKWKAEKAALEQDHAWRRQDARVTSELALDTHALRTGPIGHDVDGREYWHLREYQERMPKYTEGRYAWCLVVLGQAFPVDLNRAQEEAKEAEEADANGKQEKKDEADDSGLASLDASTDNGKAEVESEAKGVKLGLPTSLQNGTCKIEAESTTRVCMGTNDPATIKTLIDFVRFRLERVEYEENVAMQEREKGARLAKEGGDEDGSRASSPVNGDGEGGTTNAGGESMYSIRKAKQTLRDTQEERRKQVEQLLKRLNKSKEYFAWHREEVAP